LQQVDVVTQRARDCAHALLLVDGQIRTRAALAEVLRASACQVFEAATADEALALLNSRLEIDAVVVQAQVSGSMDGLALADWVRKTRPALRVLVASGGAATDAILAMLAPGSPGP
jgi:two-component system, response regulator PdtaR